MVKEHRFCHLEVTTLPQAREPPRKLPQGKVDKCAIYIYISERVTPQPLWLDVGGVLKKWVNPYLTSNSIDLYLSFLGELWKNSFPFGPSNCYAQLRCGHLHWRRFEDLT